MTPTVFYVTRAGCVDDRPRRAFIRAMFEREIVHLAPPIRRPPPASTAPACPGVP